MKTKWNDVVVNNNVVAFDMIAPIYIWQEVMPDIKIEDLIVELVGKDLFEYRTKEVDAEMVLKFMDIMYEWSKVNFIRMDEKIINKIKNNLMPGFMIKRPVVIQYDSLFKLYVKHRFDADPEWRLFCGYIAELPNFVDCYGILE